jgi:hypothetical protein
LLISISILDLFSILLKTGDVHYPSSVLSFANLTTQRIKKRVCECELEMVQNCRFTDASAPARRDPYQIWTMVYELGLLKLLCKSPSRFFCLETTYRPGSFYFSEKFTTYSDRQCSSIKVEIPSYHFPWLVSNQNIT